MLKYFLFTVFLLVFGLCVTANGFADHPADINVRDFGAVGDGRHLDHPAINKAIAACAAKGGGTVYFPAGNYLCGSIRLQNNIEINLAAGAVITGAGSEMHAYDSAELFLGKAYQDGGHTYFHNSLIWGENLTNVSISGAGMIDGGGLTNEDNENKGEPTGGSIGTGDKAIALKNCRQISIRDITIFHGGHFAILLTGCDIVRIERVTIDSNRDGIDVDCCSNTLISGCLVNTPNDDAICPKSSYALNRPVITENLIITNCQVSGFVEGTLLNGKRIPAKAGWSKGRIKFGTESNGGFRNCIVADCLFTYCDGMALEEVDGGTMENIQVKNLVMNHITHYPLYITLGMRNRGPAVSTRPGIVRNIVVSDILVTGADQWSGIQLTGSPGHPMEHISLKNIYVEYDGGGKKSKTDSAFPELAKGYPEPFLLGANPAYGLFARHITNLSLENIVFTTITKDERPAVIGEDIDQLSIQRLSYPDSAAGNGIRLKNVRSKNIDY